MTFMAPLDGSTSELYVSPQIEELLGFSAQEWLDDSFLWYRQLHPDDQVRWAESFAHTCFSGERFRAEFRFLARDGRVVWVHGEAKLVMDEHGAPSFLHGVAFDITERKRAEEATLAAYDEIRRLKDQLQADNVYLQEEIKLKCNFGEIVGQTPAIQRVLHQVEQVAGTSATVLLLGETGTGKELLARAIHSGSPRRARPMLTLNGAALPATLIESELFGHEKGALHRRMARQIGRFEQADGSSLFLDEIGELPLEVQVKLLRVLQYGQFERLGSTRTLSADVRIIAASNRDLETMVKQGRFREDLFYRLNVFPIRLPPSQGAARGYSAFGLVVRQRVRPNHGPEDRIHPPRHRGSAQVLLLAREHSRAAQCHRARHDRLSRSDAPGRSAFLVQWDDLHAGLAYRSVSAHQWINFRRHAAQPNLGGPPADRLARQRQERRGGHPWSQADNA